jgi:hypothetical protein
MFVTGRIPKYNTQNIPIKFVPSGWTDRRTVMEKLIDAFCGYVKASRNVFIFPSLCLRPRIEVMK